MKYEARLYREEMNGDRFCYFNVTEEETDLQIGVLQMEWNEKMQVITREVVSGLRAELKKYIEFHPLFYLSHSPTDALQTAPEIARIMSESSTGAGVGPMAAVAGAFAKLVGEALCREFELTNIIVENGGDLWMKVSETVTVRIDAGPSPLSGATGIEIIPDQTPCGICTSSGSTGHSFSYGKADSVTVVAPCAAVADVWATALCNRVQNESDLVTITEFSKQIPEIRGVVAILNDRIAASGNITLKKLQ